MDEKILDGLVRIGTVTAVDSAAHRVRCKFKDTDITSGWLSVLQHFGTPVNIDTAGSHTHTIKDSYSGGGSASKAGAHSHDGSTAYWMPKVNDTVLALYLPVFNADGFVLGGIV